MTKCFRYVLVHLKYQDIFFPICPKWYLAMQIFVIIYFCIYLFAQAATTPVLRGNELMCPFDDKIHI